MAYAHPCHFHITGIILVLGLKDLLAPRYNSTLLKDQEFRFEQKGEGSGGFLDMELDPPIVRGTFTVFPTPLELKGDSWGGGAVPRCSRDFGHMWHWPELRTKSEALYTLERNSAGAVPGQMMNW